MGNIAQTVCQRSYQKIVPLPLYDLTGCSLDLSTGASVGSDSQGLKVA